jgi:large subunit ribosomal protein L9
MRYNIGYIDFVCPRARAAAKKEGTKVKVILLKDVKGTGKREQVLEVSDGYARNFLLPRKLAVQASANAINTIQNAKSAEEHRQAQQRAATLELAKQMKDKEVRLKAKAGANGRLFGSITGEAIAEAIKQQLGVEVDKRKIETGEPIKQAGRFELTVRLGPNITARMFAIVEVD